MCFEGNEQVCSIINEIFCKGQYEWLTDKWDQTSRIKKIKCWYFSSVKLTFTKQT